MMEDTAQSYGKYIVNAHKREKFADKGALWSQEVVLASQFGRLSYHLETICQGDNYL